MRHLLDNSFQTVKRNYRNKLKRIKLGFCAKCSGQPADHSGGKRTGTSSAFCLRHLLEQWERNRSRAEFKAWTRAGGDLVTWNVITRWKQMETIKTAEAFGTS